jgi:hypothetical protein
MPLTMSTASYGTGELSEPLVLVQRRTSGAGCALQQSSAWRMAAGPGGLAGLLPGHRADGPARRLRQVNRVG